MRKRETSIITNMTEGPLVKQLILFALPVIIGNILQSCYTIVDMAMVGKLIGPDGLSAVGVGGVLQNLILMVGLGIGLGGQIVLSQQVGADDRVQIRRVIGSFMTITVFFAILFGLMGLSLTDWLIELLNTPSEVAAQTRNYYLVCCFGIIFIYGYNGVGAIFRGLGESRLPAIFIAIAAILNIILDYVFIAVLHMEVEGAALATVISQGISFLISLWYLRQHQDKLHFEFKAENFRLDKESTSAIIRVSFPMVVYSLVISIAAMFINSNVNIYGIAASAVDGIGSKINMIIVGITTGIYTGGAAIVGQCFGAGKLGRIKTAFYATTGLSLIIWGIVGLGMVLLARPIFLIFTNNTEVLSMAGRFIMIDVFYFLGMSLATGSYALLDGVAATGIEMVIGILESLLIKVVCGIIFSRWFGVYGYWIGNSLGAFTTPVLVYLYFVSGVWKRRKAALHKIAE